MRKTYLEAPRIVLQTLLSSDAPFLVDLDSDPDVMRYLTDGKPTELAAAQETVTTVLKKMEQWEGRFGTWLAFEKSTGDFIGWFLLRPAKATPDDHHHLELGYRFKKKYWGKGFATEVSKLLVKKAFLDLNAESVFATAMAPNHGSTGVMKKVGMKFHSEYIENLFPGENKLAVKYSISKSDWLDLQRLEHGNLNPKES